MFRKIIDNENNEFYVKEIFQHKLECFSEHMKSFKLKISDCPNLKEIDLTDCLVGDLEITNCPNLETLKIKGNNIIMVDLRNCQNLKELEIDPHCFAMITPDVSLEFTHPLKTYIEEEINKEREIREEIERNYQNIVINLARSNVRTNRQNQQIDIWKGLVKDYQRNLQNTTVTIQNHLGLESLNNLPLLPQGTNLQQIINEINTAETRLNTTARGINNLPQLPPNETVNSLLNRPTQQDLQNHQQTRNEMQELQRQLENLQIQLTNLTNEQNNTQQQLDTERQSRIISRERSQAQINNLQQENQRLQLINQGLTGGLERHLDNELTANIIQNVNNNPPFYGRRD